MDMALGRGRVLVVAGHLVNELDLHMVGRAGLFPPMFES